MKDKVFIIGSGGIGSEIRAILKTENLDHSNIVIVDDVHDLPEIKEVKTREFEIINPRVHLEAPKDGRTKRRDRRKQERKNKK